MTLEVGGRLIEARRDGAPVRAMYARQVYEITGLKPLTVNGEAKAGPYFYAELRAVPDEEVAAET